MTPRIYDFYGLIVTMGFAGGSDSKESACSAGDLGLTPGLGRSPGGGHGNPLQYSCLENPMDRGSCLATVHGITESDTTEQLNTAHHNNGLAAVNKSSLHIIIKEK